ncbi:MAG: hypothetical protein IJT98_07115 [Prevotella sp.]|nr:hypothetical protein [Prevotella sp.]
MKFFAGVSKTATSEVLKTSAAVKVDDTVLTKDGETNGYSVSSNTIILTNDIQYTSTPSDIKLVKTITYDDASTDDDDVDVAFDGTVEEGYYIGTASIGLSGSETDYTVKVKKNTTPTLTATTASVTVASPRVATGTQTFTVTGANLAGETVSLSFASAVAGLSVDKTSIAVVDGAVNAEVTVSYKSNADVAAASVNLTISSTGVADIVIPVNYSSTAAITTIETVSAKTTWNWSTSGQSSTVNSPISTEYVVFANADGWDESFKANAIAGKATYFYYAKNSTYYTQANGLKIKTSTDGILIVKFNNTGGGSRPYRWLAVQGTVTDYKSKDETRVTATVPVTAGEILIESIMGTTDANAKPTYTEANAMFNFFEITFIPDVTINLNASGFATYSAGYDFIVSGATAYQMALDLGAGTINGTAAPAKIPAGAGILLKGEANAEVTISGTTDAAALTDNSLKGTTKADGTTAMVGTANYYVLSGNSFRPYTGTEFAANKAYFEVEAAAAARTFTMTFGEEEITAIESINTAISEGEGTVYDLQGRRVAQPQRGLYIMNGRKVLVRDKR